MRGERVAATPPTTITESANTRMASFMDISPLGGYKKPENGLALHLNRSQSLTSSPVFALRCVNKNSPDYQRHMAAISQMGRDPLQFLLYPSQSHECGEGCGRVSQRPGADFLACSVTLGCASLVLGYFRVFPTGRKAAPGQPVSNSQGCSGSSDWPASQPRSNSLAAC